MASCTVAGCTRTYEALGLCKFHYQRQRDGVPLDFQKPPPKLDPCEAEGCAKPRRSLQSPWCAMHYHRWYRHGDPSIVAAKGKQWRHSSGYVLVVPPADHPLRLGVRGVYVHRVVLFDKIGAGDHRCHWVRYECDVGEGPSGARSTGCGSSGRGEGQQRPVEPCPLVPPLQHRPLLPTSSVGVRAMQFQ